MVFPPCELRIWEVWNIAAAAAAAAATLAFFQHKSDMLFHSQYIDQSRGMAPFNCTVVGELVGSPWIFSQMSLPQKDDQIFT